MWPFEQSIKENLWEELEIIRIIRFRKTLGVKKS